MPRVDAPQDAPEFRAPEQGPRRPQPHRHPAQVLRLAGRPRDRWSARDDRRHLADRGLHGSPRRATSASSTSTSPSATIDECREKDLTYSRPLTVTVAFINHETGEIREQSVFMGDFPWMTERGTFIINGTERVVVTQLVRSPGAYLMEPKDREKQVFTANLMPARGSWLELEIDKKGKVFVRIDRKRKLPVTVLLRAMTYNPETDGSVEESVEDIERLDQELARPLRQLALPAQHDRERPRQHEDQEGRAHRALQEAAPRRAAERRRRLRAAAAALLRPQALRPHARRALQAQLAPEPRHRPRHAHAHARRHPRARARARVACPSSSASPRTARSRSRTTRPRPSRCRASRSPSTSTSTSTSATAACAPSASSSRRPSASASTAWSASSASASRPRTRTRSRRRRS